MAMFGKHAAKPFAYPAAQLYQETPRDKVANFFLKTVGDNYDTRKFARNMFGSSGIGGGPISPIGSLMDMTPAGVPFQLNEAGAKIGRGQTLGGLLDAALAVVPIPAAAKGLKAVARRGEKQAAKGITAYQGGPHAFKAERLVAMPDGSHQYIEGGVDALPDVPPGAKVVQDFPLGRMRDDKIGTGEGAQAYGMGHYLAQAEGTAKEYRNALALPSSPQNDAIKFWLNEAGGDKAKAANLYRDHARQTGQHGPDADKFAQELEGAPGSMYQVRINADPEHFLDWDKPLNQQPDVYAAMKRGLNYDDMPHGSKMGRDVARGREQELQKAGIPGIKYLDQGSRAAGDGSRNFVVFDPKIISIMKRYGVTGPVAAMIAAGQMRPPPEQSN